MKVYNGTNKRLSIEQYVGEDDGKSTLIPIKQAVDVDLVNSSGIYIFFAKDKRGRKKKKAVATELIIA